jgi:uncharacterized protein (DUF2141 family)
MKARNRLFRAESANIALGVLVSLPVLSAISSFATAASDDAAENSLSLAGPYACSSDNVHIEVTVDNLQNSNGLLAAVLYNGEPRDFLASGRSVQKTRVRPQPGTTRLCIDAPAHGRYALVVYHDANGNRKFDFSLFGRPKEGAGFSNNPQIDGRLPDHSQVVFDVDEDIEKVRVAISYP